MAVADPNSWLVNVWSEKSSEHPDLDAARPTSPRGATAAATGTGKISAVLGDSNGAVATGTAAARTATTSAAASRAVMFSVAVSPGDDTTEPAQHRADRELHLVLRRR